MGAAQSVLQEPGWLGDWRNNGCLANGRTNWSRRVDAKGDNWETAANKLKVSDEVLSNMKLINVTTKNEGIGGMWVIGEREDGECFIYTGKENNDGCGEIGKTKKAKQCNNWPAGWIASNDVVNACKTKAPANSTVSIKGSQVWAEWQELDTNCEPGWSTEWINDGCLANGRTRYTRKVDAKGFDWDKSAEFMINKNKTSNDGKISISKNTSTERNNGIWVVIELEENNCFTYSSPIKDNGCSSVGKSEKEQQCTNWPSKWDANTALDKCRQRAPSGSKVTVAGKEVWARWKSDNSECVAGPGKTIETNCIRDEDSGQDWGKDGKSAQMVSRDTCSKFGYYDAQIIDCGGWRFKAKCSGDVPKDWSTPYSDESSRSRGYNSSKDDSKKQCVDKGYMGINQNASRDKRGWAFSHQCINPGWVAEWANDGFCGANGETLYSRKVDPKSFDLDVATDWLINNDTSDFYDVQKERRNENKDMWVLAKKKDNKCYIKTDVKDDVCDTPGRRKQLEQCNNIPSGWTDINKVVENCKKKGTVIVKDNKAYLEWSRVDSTCNPEWVGDWINNGCQEDDTTLYSRRVNAKDFDLDIAADWLIENDTKQNGFMKIGKEKRNDVMWVLAKKDKECIITPQEWSINECLDYGVSTSTAKLNVPISMEPSMAASNYARSIRGKHVKGKIVVNSTGSSDAKGAYATVTFNDVSCFSKAK